MCEALSTDVFVPGDEPGLGWLEEAYAAVNEAKVVERVMRKAVKDKKLAKKPAATLAARALDAGIISPSEMQILERAVELRDRSVAVDSFEPGSYAQQIAS